MFKKAILLFVCLGFCVSLLCACGVKPEQGNENLAEDISIEHTQETTEASVGSILAIETVSEPNQNVTNKPETPEEIVVPAWKTAYLNLLESKKDIHFSYSLVYIDDDDIPELYLSGDCEATGDGVYSYKNGRVFEQRLIRIGGGSYIERGGELINKNGNMGACYTHVYKLTDDGFILTFSALSVERIQHLGNDEYDLSYEYSIEDVTVTEEEYNAAVDAAFDFDRAVMLYENTVEYDVIKQQIIDYK